MTAFSNGFLVTRQCMLSYICKHFGFKASFFCSNIFVSKKDLSAAEIFGFEARLLFKQFGLKARFPPTNIVVSKQSDLLVSKQDFCSNILVSKLDLSSDQYWKQDFFRKYLKQGLDQHICKKNKKKVSKQHFCFICNYKTCQEHCHRLSCMRMYILIYLLKKLCWQTKMFQRIVQTLKHHNAKHKHYNYKQTLRTKRTHSIVHKQNSCFLIKNVWTQSHFWNLLFWQPSWFGKKKEEKKNCL